MCFNYIRQYKCGHIISRICNSRLHLILAEVHYLLQHISAEKPGNMMWAWNVLKNKWSHTVKVDIIIIVRFSWHHVRRQTSILDQNAKDVIKHWPLSAATVFGGGTGARTVEKTAPASWLSSYINSKTTNNELTVNASTDIDITQWLMFTTELMTICCVPLFLTL